MDLAALRSHVRELTSITSTAVLPDDELTRFVNEANRFVLTLADWPQLRKQVSWVHPEDTAQYDLSTLLNAEAHRVIDVFVQEQPGARPRQLFDRTAPLLNEDRTGAAREFSWDPTTSEITLWPKPSHELWCTAVFVVEPVDLVADSDASIFPARFAQAISLIAANRVLEREGDSSDRRQTFEGRAYQVIDQAKRVLLTPARRTVVLGGRRTRRRGTRYGSY